MGNLEGMASGYLPDGFAFIGFDLNAVKGETDAAHRETPFAGPGFGARPTSAGKNFMTEVRELGAAWPNPQIDASRIAIDNSVSKAWSQPRAAISFTAFSVPARHGVHWP